MRSHTIQHVRSHGQITWTQNNKFTNSRPLRLRRQNPSSSGSGVEAALRFEDLHRRLKLLAGLNNRAPILHLLHALSDTGTAAAAVARRHAGAAGILPQVPPRVFSEPSAGLSGIEHVGRQEAGLGAAPAAPAGATGYGRGVSNGRALGGEGGERRHGEASEGERVDRHRPRSSGRAVARGVRATTEVTERTLLKGILYAFQVQRRTFGACGGFGGCHHNCYNTYTCFPEAGRRFLRARVTVVDEVRFGPEAAHTACCKHRVLLVCVRNFV